MFRRVRKVAAPGAKLLPTLAGLFVLKNENKKTRINVEHEN